jgi:hypothetical protein
MRPRNYAVNTARTGAIIRFGLATRTARSGPKFGTYDHVESWDHSPLKALASDLGLECAILPKELGMWVPGETVPVVFYQSENSHRPAIEAAIERMMKELSRSDYWLMELARYKEERNIS